MSLISVNQSEPIIVKSAQSVAKVVEEDFGPKFQQAGGTIVFGDNDKKLHSDVHLNSSRI